MSYDPKRPMHSATKRSLRRRLLGVQLGLCAICGQPLEEHAALPEMLPSLDHVIPITAGGPDRPGNYVAAHVACNVTKGNRRPTGCELIYLLAVNNRMGEKPMRW